MTCHRLDLGDGVTGFVCTETKRRACSSCRSSIKAEQGVLCDWPLTGPKAGKTCDRFVCQRCAKHVGEDRDYCPTHAEIAERRLGVVNGIDYRPPCPRTGVGPDGVERFCANHIRHPGRCEFIYLAVKR